MTDFTPVASGTGGLLIGAAAVLLLLTLGRIAGISGILGGVVARSPGPMAWRVAFLAGLPLGAFVVAQLQGGAEIVVGASPVVLVGAGLLVGYGTQLGSGCTSGHGVCGIARGAKRSIAATVVFMLAGFATVYVMRHVAGGGV